MTEPTPTKLALVQAQQALANAEATYAAAKDAYATAVAEKDAVVRPLGFAANDAELALGAARIALRDAQIADELAIESITLETKSTAP